MAIPTTSFEPFYAVDTHPLYWYLTPSNKLSKQVSDIFDAAEKGQTRLIISAVVIAELYWVNKKWNGIPDFKHAFTSLKAEPYIRLVDFKSDDVMDFPKTTLRCLTVLLPI